MSLVLQGGGPQHFDPNPLMTSFMNLSQLNSQIIASLNDGSTGTGGIILATRITAPVAVFTGNSIGYGVILPSVAPAQQINNVYTGTPCQLQIIQNLNLHNCTVYADPLDGTGITGNGSNNAASFGLSTGRFMLLALIGKTWYYTLGATS